MQDDERPGGALGAGVARPRWPVEEGSPGVRGIGGGEDEWSDVVPGITACTEALIGPGQRELRAPASLDEVAAAHAPLILESLEDLVDHGEAAGDPLGVRGLAISLSVAYSVVAVLGLLVLRSDPNSPGHSLVVSKQGGAPK